MRRLMSALPPPEAIGRRLTHNLRRVVGRLGFFRRLTA
ncbi:GINS complex protein [Zea mays]|uniref:GINS complex protein n=1 Tax=Zea mays TaxID=4577 RepID=A0A1D6QJH2_MAIZE|nr:GINS complex protein [Zea mays]AQK57937.1 GINS complex protein [Zea mays]